MSQYICPECDSNLVTVAQVQLFMVNTGDHYVFSTKTHDSDSPATCITCRWEGERSQLIYKHEDQDNE